MRNRSHYKPRGTPYAPVRRRFATTAAAPRTSEGDPSEKIVEGSQPVADAPLTAPVLATVTNAAARRTRAWHARESIVIPVLLSAAVIALMKYYPAHGPISARTAAVAQITDQSPIALIEATGVAAYSVSVLPVVSGSSASAALVQGAPLAAIDVAATDLAVRDVDHIGAIPHVRSCSVADPSAQPLQPAALPPADFGRALAAAAELQTRDFVVYDDEYRVIRYPGGDVASLYGVCSDVVVRAYRALGLDLQRLVHESRVGSGDTNISHRRTEALRRFFTKAGAALPVTDSAEDYLPGDVVSYNRPQNRHGNDHIAIVSNVTGPSGRPMIVHNRGYGPQVEDALFVDEITGHYRFDGSASAIAASRVAQRTPGRIRNSVASLVRRAASLRAAAKNSTQKQTPKL